MNQPDHRPVCEPVAGLWKHVLAGLLWFLLSLNEDAHCHQARFAGKVPVPGRHTTCSFLGRVEGVGSDSFQTFSSYFLLCPSRQPALHMFFEVKRLAGKGSMGATRVGWNHRASLRAHHFGLDSRLTRTADYTLLTVR